MTFAIGFTIGVAFVLAFLISAAMVAKRFDDMRAEFEHRLSNRKDDMMRLEKQFDDLRKHVNVIVEHAGPHSRRIDRLEMYLGKILKHLGIEEQ